jgi:hypothetical protein
MTTKLLLKISPVLILLLSGFSAMAQPTQTVRGKVIDSESNFPLVGAKVSIYTSDTTKFYRAVSDANGDFRGFNHPTTTVWLQSPEFVLSPGGSISISQIYLMENSEPPPLSTASVNPSKSPTGWAGIALIDSSGSVVFTYSQTSVWESVIFTSESLALLAGETLTLNFIVEFNGLIKCMVITSGHK